MNTIRPYLKFDATADDVKDVFDKHPAIAKYFKEMHASHRHRVRLSIGTKYSKEVVDALLPIRKSGRVAYTGPFALLSGPGRDIIINIAGSLEGVTSPEIASQIADALAEKYNNNLTSQMMNLGAFRHGLMVMSGIDANDARKNEIVAATYRPQITKAFNDSRKPVFLARVDAGLNLPEPYKNLDDLVARAKAFIQDHRTVSPQQAADFLVIMSARPGEAETLQIGERGGVTGMLKKRKTNVDKQYNLVSAVGFDIAEQYLAAWLHAGSAAKRAAMLKLKDLCATWGIQRRDLRAVGSALAVKAEMLSGNVSNVQQQRDVHAAALRHEPTKPHPQQHYERVNDPLMQLYAQLSQLSPEQLDAVRSIVAQK